MMDIERAKQVMGMREKLIELLRGVIKFHEEQKEKWILGGKVGNRPSITESFVDILIANGVTIPARCKDCVHSIWDEENEMWKCIESAEYDSNFGDYIGWVSYHNDDFYCSYGERRTNG